MPFAKQDDYRRYMREYMKRRYNERVAEARKLLGGQCAHCGSIENLQVDHIDWRLKKLKVDRMAGVKHEKFLEELAKCQLLCEEHHIEKSRNDISEIRQAQERRKRMKTTDDKT